MAYKCVGIHTGVSKKSNQSYAQIYYVKTVPETLNKYGSFGCTAGMFWTPKGYDNNSITPGVIGKEFDVDFTINDYGQTIVSNIRFTK